MQFHLISMQHGQIVKVFQAEPVSSISSKYYSCTGDLWAIRVQTHSPPRSI